MRMHDRRDDRPRARQRVRGIAPLLALAACAGPAPRVAAPPADARAAAAEPGLVALGDSIFHGRVGGALCAVCHGQRGGGTPRGARLSDATWTHADGTLPSIAAVVARGVPGADTAAVPMLGHGGAQLTERQVRAVAAYVHQLGGGRR